MFLKKPLSLFNSMAFRLTAWYAGIFTLSTGIAFFFFYILIISVNTRNMDQALLDRIHSFSTILSTEGVAAVKRRVVLEAQAAGEKKVFFRLLYMDGSVFSTSNMSYWRDIGVDKTAIRQLIRGRSYIFESISVPEIKHTVRVLYGFIGNGIIMQVGQSMEGHTHIFNAFKKIFFLTMSILIIFAALIGWFMARQALSGVEAMTRTARDISEGDLDKRVPMTTGKSELDQLAMTFNHMLDRIQSLITSTKEITDNIAHDLKSPITRIRGIAEVTLTTAVSGDEYEKMAANAIEECDRILDMINTMLVISKTDAGLEKLNFVDIEIARIVQQACELFASIAEDRGIKLICHIPDQERMRGDVKMIQRLIANLMDNAIKYTDTGGTVMINITPAYENNEYILISIKDTGIGIHEKDLSRVFERFYRCDPSRSRAGMGLGLSLARAITKAHNGDITVSSTVGKGSTFTVKLPRYPDKDKKI